MDAFTAALYTSVQVPVLFSSPCCHVHLCTPLWQSAMGYLEGRPPKKTQSASNVTARYSEAEVIWQKHTLTLRRSQRHWGPQLYRVITWMITLRRTTLVVSTSSSELSEDRNPSSSAISWETAHNQRGSIYYVCMALLQHTPAECGFSLNLTFMVLPKKWLQTRGMRE